MPRAELNTAEFSVLLPVAAVPEGEAGVLEGNLSIPEKAKGVILFAHGSGSGRHSPRNQFVAEELNRGRFATLLLDLLTPTEEATDAQTGLLRFNIEFLAERIVAATNWLKENRATENL